MNQGLGTPPEVPGWAGDPLVDVAFSRAAERAAEIKAEVLDGLTGQPIRTAVDGAEAEVHLDEPDRLLEVSVEDLIHDLAIAQRRAAVAKSEAKEAARYASEMQAAVGELVDELCRRDAPAQTEMAFDDGEPLDGDGDN